MTYGNGYDVCMELDMMYINGYGICTGIYLAGYIYIGYGHLTVTQFFL